MAVNWDQLLGNDPIRQAILDQIASRAATSAGDLTAQRRRALALYGEIPADLGADVNGDIDPVTRGLAGAATESGVSTVARLRHAYEQAQSRSMGSVGERGLGRSGAVGQHTRENLYDFTQAQFGAAQSLQDQLNAALQTHLGNVRQGDVDTGQATNDALQRAVAQINAGLISGATTPGATSGAGQTSPAGPRSPYGYATGYSASPGRQPAMPGFTQPPRPPAAPRQPASVGLAKSLRLDRGY